MTSRALEEAILSLLDQRKPGATICPSEVARQEFDPEHWRDQMETVRRAGRRLAEEGRIVVTQGGNPVDPQTAQGAIRYRLAVPH